MYITSRRRTLWLGLLPGLYERFPIRNLIRYSPPTQAGLYRVGTLQYYFLHDSNPSGPLINNLKYFLIRFRFRRDLKVRIFYSAVCILTPQWSFLKVQISGRYRNRIQPRFSLFVSGAQMDSNHEKMKVENPLTYNLPFEVCIRLNKCSPVLQVANNEDDSTDAISCFSATPADSG